MPEPVCWIDDIDYRDANLHLRTIYEQVLSPNGQLDNLYRGFSLSPQTILPADTLYKAALHHSNNVLSNTFAELIGTYVAILSGCAYAQAHHGQNYISLSTDTKAAQHVVKAISQNSTHTSDSVDLGKTIGTNCTRQEVTALNYVRKLCEQPAEITKEDINTLREADWCDKEISEIVQVVAMFSYFVRVINGVGIQLGDEQLGLYS